MPFLRGMLDILPTVCYYSEQKGGRHIEQTKKEKRQQDRAGKLLEPCYRNSELCDSYSTANRKAIRVKDRGSNPLVLTRVSHKMLNVKLS